LKRCIAQGAKGGRQRTEKGWMNSLTGRDEKIGDDSLREGWVDGCLKAGMNRMNSLTGRDER